MPNQWETALLCNDISLWLGTLNLESGLAMYKTVFIYQFHLREYVVNIDIFSLSKCWEETLRRNILSIVIVSSQLYFASGLPHIKLIILIEFAKVIQWSAKEGSSYYFINISQTLLCTLISHIHRCLIFNLFLLPVPRVPPTWHGYWLVWNQRIWTTVADPVYSRQSLCE